MASGFQNYQKLESLTAAIEQLFVGGNEDDASYGGETKPSFDKRFKQLFLELQSMVYDNATPYETKADMLAAGAPSGGVLLAKVLRDPVLENNGLYDYLDGAWVKSLYDGVSLGIALTAIVQQSLRHHDELISGIRGSEQISSEFAWAVVDSENQVAVGVRHNGKVSLSRDTEIDDQGVYRNGYQWGVVDEGGALAIGVKGDGKVDLVRAGEVISDATYSDDLVYGLLDQDNRVAFGIKRSGELIGKFSEGSGTGVPVDQNSVSGPGNVFMARSLFPGLVEFLADGEGATRAYRQRRDIPSETAMFSASGPIEYIAATGQSLSVGGGATENAPGEEVFTESPVYPHHNFMFNTGTRGVESGGLDPSTLIDFVPAFESFNGSNQAETQGSGMMRALHAGSEQHRTFVYRSHGKGGAKLAELSKGSGFNMYDNGLKEVRAAVAIAEKYGRDIRMRAFTWTQGESDRFTDRGEYYSGLSQLIDDYRYDYAQELPEGNPPLVCIIDQMCANSSGDVGNPPLAQYDLSRDLSHVYISTPKYFMAFSGVVHLVPIWYSILGEYQARAWSALFVENDEWRPVSPLSVSRAGNVIDVVFSVPSPPLVFDHETLPAALNEGFVFSDSSGSTPGISSVELVSDDTVRITLDSSPAGPDMKISYGTEGAGAVGRAGAWGNLHDSDTTVSQSDPAVTLFNWAVIFEESVA